jgi:hypothetical protein
MAGFTGGFLVESLVQMAVAAIERGVDFPQHDTSDFAMIEGGGAPVSVAGCAGAIQTGDVLTVAGVAGQGFMESVQGPSGLIVCKASRFLLAVTFVTGRILVAVKAPSMRVAGDLGRHDLFMRVMTGTAAFAAVAFDTIQSVQTHVLIVVEGDDRSFFHLGLVHPFSGFSNQWSFWFFNLNDLAFFSFLEVADGTIGATAPILMAVHALLMIGAFQSGQGGVIGVDFESMASYAGWDFAGGTVVVTFGASFAKYRHVGMVSVGEFHREIQVFQLVQDDDIGTFFL